jgi:hypothetical protein
MHLSPRRLPGIWIAVAMALVLAGCTTSTVSPSSAASASSAVSASEVPSASNGPSWTLVVFGDSWPNGGHCNGCNPWPGLLADGLATTTGRHIQFVNRTTGGGTAQELLQTFKSSESIRATIADADIIVISIGDNDYEPAFNAYVAGSCGGLDQLDCFRALSDTLRVLWDGLLTEIDGLRGGKPTAVRMVTTANEYLTDPGLIDVFGPEFGKTGGVVITTMMRDTECQVADAHHARCVDLGLALNGPDRLVPVDTNTQESMQLVADTILATGLAELR